MTHGMFLALNVLRSTSICQMGWVNIFKLWPRSLALTEECTVQSRSCGWRANIDLSNLCCSLMVGLFCAGLVPWCKLEQPEMFCYPRSTGNTNEYLQDDVPCLLIVPKGCYHSLALSVWGQYLVVPQSSWPCPLHWPQRGMA